MRPFGGVWRLRWGPVRGTCVSRGEHLGRFRAPARPESGARVPRVPACRMSRGRRRPSMSRALASAGRQDKRGFPGSRGWPWVRVGFRHGVTGPVWRGFWALELECGGVVGGVRGGGARSAGIRVRTSAGARLAGGCALRTLRLESRRRPRTPGVAVQEGWVRYRHAAGVCARACALRSAAGVLGGSASPCPAWAARALGAPTAS